MNRRSFLTGLIQGIGVFSILPPASTYSRIWKVTREPIGIYEMLMTCKSVEPINLDLKGLILQLYAVQKERAKLGRQDTIEIWCSAEAASLYA